MLLSNGTYFCVYSGPYGLLRTENIMFKMVSHRVKLEKINMFLLVMHQITHSSPSHITFWEALVSYHRNA